MAKAQVNDPIRYSDWDAIQNVVYEQIGPLQEVVSSPGVYVEGSGYGVALEDLNSKPYPFTRQVKRISSEANARVEFTEKHRLVVGEVIFFNNFVTHPGATNTNNWSGYDIAENFAVVTNLVDGADGTIVEVDFSTFDYNPSGNGAVLWETYAPASGGTPAAGHSCDAVQYYISANQFKNLRADVALAVEQITGAVPGTGNTFPGGESTELPTPQRGAQIFHSVYDPYYDVITAANQYKYFSAVQNTYQPSLGASARNASEWNGTTNFEFYIDFNDGYDFVQFFNTGGLIQINFPESTPVQDANNDRVYNLNRHWRDMLRLVFPLYVGGRGKAAMGLSADSRSISDLGAFDVGGVDTLIASATGNQVTAYGNFYDDHKIEVFMRELVNQERLNFIITLTDTSDNNDYAKNTDVDREIQIIYNYSSVVPLRSTPQNYTVGLIRTWTA